MHHPDRAQALLRLRKHCALLFLNECRFAANSVREKINRGDNQRNNRKRQERELPIQPHHDHERAGKCDSRSKNVGEPFVVDRLDRLRIIGDAETGIARTASIVIFERERLQVGVEIGAQLKQRLQTDFHEQVICNPIDDSPEKLNRD